MVKLSKRYSHHHDSGLSVVRWAVTQLPPTTGSSSLQRGQRLLFRRFHRWAELGSRLDQVHHRREGRRQQSL